jgi:hypothetical protein
LPAPIDLKHAINQFVRQRLEIGVRDGLGEACGVDQNIEPAIAVLDAGAQREQCRAIRHVGHEGGMTVAGQALDDLAGFSDAIGAWHVGNCDGGAGAGQHATGGSADGTCSTDDQRDIASERFDIGHS